MPRKSTNIEIGTYSIDFFVSDIISTSDGSADTINGYLNISHLEAQLNTFQLKLSMILDGIFEYRDILNIPIDKLNKEEIFLLFEKNGVHRPLISSLMGENKVNTFAFKVALTVKIQSKLTWNGKPSLILDRSQPVNKMRVAAPQTNYPYQTVVHEIFLIDPLTQQSMRVELNTDLNKMVQYCINHYIKETLMSADEHFDIELKWQIR